MSDAERIAVLEATVKRMEDEMKNLRAGMLRGFTICDQNFARRSAVYTTRPGFCERVLGW